MTEPARSRAEATPRRLAPMLTALKSRPARLRSDLVRRDVLLRRIEDSTADVVVIAASAGSGKTTLLAQYAEEVERPVAWLSLDPTDDDPVLLLLELASALGAEVTGDVRLAAALDTGDADPDGAASIVLELLAARPGTVLILDDAHVLDSEQSRAVVRLLSERLPPGSRLVIGSRESPPIPLSRLRASGVLLELRQSDLALDQPETARIFASAGLDVTVDEVEALHRRIEGWAAGVYLASLAATEANHGPLAEPFRGDHRTIVEYLTSEILERQPEDRLDFLLRTSVLERFTPSLCDAVLGRQDAAEMIDELVRHNIFIVPLDERNEWYRYHHLFADALRARLARSSPRSIRAAHRRASAWHVANGTLAEAVDHAFAAGERTHAAELVAFNAHQLYNAGLQATILRWLAAFSEDEAAHYAPLAIITAWAGGLLGDRARSRRYLSLVERSGYEGTLPLGESSLAVAIAILRAAHGWDGVKDMRRSSETAYRLELPRGLPDARAALFYGASLVLSGRPEDAAEPLHEAAAFRETDAVGAQAAIAFLGLSALHEGDLEEASRRLLASLEIVRRRGLDGYLLAAPVHAGLAVVESTQGNATVAREQLGIALSLLPRAASWPWLSLYVQALCASATVALGDAVLAGALLKDARRDLARYPDAGVLPRLIARAENELDALRASQEGFSAPLTGAERRVFELLPTHLSAEEIGARLHISKNTVKSHQRSIYRKLGVDSRSEAVARAQQLLTDP